MTENDDTYISIDNGETLMHVGDRNMFIHRNQCSYSDAIHSILF